MLIPRNGYKWVNTEDKERLLIALSTKGLEWSEKFATIVEKAMPVVGDGVEMTFSNGNTAHGIVREVPLTGDAIMFFVRYCDGTVKYSMYENVGKTATIKFRALNNTEKFHLHQALQQHGKQWNARARRVEQIGLRLVSGKKYYHLCTNFIVGCRVDCHSNIDNRRYALGNYFRTMKQARQARDAMLESLKRFHALKQDELEK